MTDADIKRIAEAVARRLERSQRRAPAGGQGAELHLSGRGG